MRFFSSSSYIFIFRMCFSVPLFFCSVRHRIIRAFNTQHIAHIDHYWNFYMRFARFVQSIERVRFLMMIILCVFFFASLVCFDEKKNGTIFCSSFLMARIKGTSSTRILVLGLSYKTNLSDNWMLQSIAHNIRCMNKFRSKRVYSLNVWMVDVHVCGSNGTPQFSNKIELLFVHDSITISLLLLCKLFIFVIFVWMWTWPGPIIRFQFLIFNASLISTRSLPFHTVYL